MKIKYIVKIGWRRSYQFDNADAAMAFAIVAKTHIYDENEDDEVSVEIVREEDGCRPD